MGVIGLWGLLEPAGKPVPLESLENKILAVDVSIWLNQAVKGYRDKSGNTVTNAHLLGLFHRVSKLLFYKIKPVFVFDGKAPDLKKETLQRRRIRKGDASKKARVASVKILDNYVRSQAVAAQLKQQTHAMNKVLAKGQEGLHQVLNDRTQKKDKDLFELPPLQPDQGEHAVFEEDSDSDDGLKEDLLRQLNATDIHNMDVSSQQFKLLPKDLQYEILSDLTERRKQSSWSRMHEMPKSSGGFSNFQMQRLVNRSRVQKAKDNVGKEIGEENTLHVDANLFVGDVQGLKRAKAEAKRVASSASGTHYLFVKNLKQLNASAETVVKEDSNEVEILEPSSSVQMSNRSGGTFAIKQEALDDDESEDIFQDEILRVIQSEAQLGKSNARDPEPCSSKSTAVFESSSSDESDCFEEVASEYQPIPGLSLSIEINPDMKADDDMFADVFNEPPSADVPSEDDPIANMAEKMKKSDHLYLKIASKYVEPVEEVPPSSSGAQKEPDEDVFDDLDQETDKLIAEMRTQSKEERLLKIKDLDKLQAEEPKSKKVKESAPSSSKEDKRVLDQLGVESIEQSAYQSSVEKEAFKSSQPLIDDNKDDVVYGDAVAGFVRSSADAHIQNLDNSKGSSLNETILEKLDTEGEEFSRNELLELQNKLAEEHEGLIAERGQLDRLAATITDQMYAECQELLQLFGIPWIVAPSEAEAQCAFLDMNNLTHGTITDDSDIWVFGGQRTYKNFFNQDKHCEFFSAADVAKHFGLSREKLILLALMTGSDYTDGIETVGPVTGLEILAEFAGEGLEPLRKFKSWWDDAHRNLAMPPGDQKSYILHCNVVLIFFLSDIHRLQVERKAAEAAID